VLVIKHIVLVIKLFEQINFMRQPLNCKYSSNK